MNNSVFKVSATGICYEERTYQYSEQVKTLIHGIVSVIDDIPSVVTYRSGHISSQSWIHDYDWYVRENDQPNLIEYNIENNKSYIIGMCWFNANGDRHRYLKPATIMFNKDGSVLSAVYYKHDRVITTALDGFTEGTLEFEFQWEMA